MEKEQKKFWLSKEAIQKLDEIILHFEKSNAFGKITKSSVVEVAIKQLHESYIGD